MQRISTPTRAIDLFGPGKDGFKNGNLASADLATDLNAGFFNAVQEELCRAVEECGIELDGNVRTQLLQAIRRLAGGYVRTVAAGATVLTPDDAGLVLIDASAGAVALALPKAEIVRAMPLTLRRIDNSVNAVTVSCAGASADVFDLTLATSVQLRANELLKLRSNGIAAWLVDSWHGPRFARFVANGNFFVPFVSRVFATGCAGGGGGGANPSFSGANIRSGCGGGGAGQAQQCFPVDVEPGTTLAVAIGAAGLGGTPLSPQGLNGGNTTLGALLTMVGGGGGSAGTQTAASNGSIAGGFAGSGYPGGQIGQDSSMPGASATGGCGGNGPFGGGGAGGRGAASSGISSDMIPGADAGGFGGGGGGAGGIYAVDPAPTGGVGASGGTGSPGWLLLEW